MTGFPVGAAQSVAVGGAGAAGAVEAAAEAVAGLVAKAREGAAGTRELQAPRKEAVTRAQQG